MKKLSAMEDGLNAIAVFAVCFLPESGQPNYRCLMDNLFTCVIGTLELLVAENYMTVYLNGNDLKKYAQFGMAQDMLPANW